MAKSGKIFSDLFGSPMKAKNTTKSTIWIVVLLLFLAFVVPYLVKMIKKAFEKSDSEEEREDKLEYIQEVTDDIVFSDVSLSDGDAMARANKLEQAMEGAGTNMQMIYEAIGTDVKVDVDSSQTDVLISQGYSIVSMGVSTFLGFTTGVTVTAVKWLEADDLKFVYSKFGMRKWGWFFTDETDLGSWIRSDVSGDDLALLIEVFANRGIII